MYIVSITPFLRPLAFLFVCFFSPKEDIAYSLWFALCGFSRSLHRNCTFAEFGNLNKNWIRLHFDVPSLILLAIEKFTPCTEVGFKAISYMRKHRVFLDWNNRRFCICILITGCFSVLVLITRLDSLCVLWLTLPFKSGTDYSECRLPTWLLNLHRIEPWCELPSQCFLVQPLIGHLKAWFTHFSVIHQLRYLVLQKLFFCIMFRYWQCVIHTRYYGHGNSRQYYDIGGLKVLLLE